MPTIPIPIHPTRGPIVQVRVASPKRGEMLDAMIDTGAERTSIDAEQARMLGLEEIGTTDVVTPSTGSDAVQRKMWRGNLTFEAGKFACDLQGVELVEADIANQGFSLLLGRDVLSKFIFLWDGPANRTTVFV